MLMVIDEKLFAQELIGRVRTTMAKELGLIDEDKLNFL
jgi:aspartyl-tRNA synthetase